MLFNKDITVIEICKGDLKITDYLTEKFRIVEICEGCLKITHHLSGKRKDVNKDIEKIKKRSTSFEMIGKNGMIVWE